MRYLKIQVKYIRNKARKLDIFFLNNKIIYK